MAAISSLADALRVVESITRSTTKVCTSQSSILLDVIDHVGCFLKQIEELEGLNGADEGKASVWDETTAVLQRGCHLLRSCHNDTAWIVRGLLFAESRKEFHTICGEMYNCVDLISIYLFEVAESASVKSKIGEAYISCLSKYSSSMLEKAGTSDEKQLLSLALNRESGETTEIQKAKDILSSRLLGRLPEINLKDLELRGHLGGGAYGTVYEARWLGESVAVKVFDAGDTSFDNELKVLQTYKHPNVLHVAGHSFDERKRQHSLVMEKMDMDLTNYLRKKKHPLPLLLLVEVMLQVATGMAWLHSKNVIHRDLKPQNVLVCEKDNVLLSIRIADFGVSRPNFFTSASTELTAKQGTRGFMAPEVWNGERYSKRADVYSYGMLCYHLCTGNTPFKAGVDMQQVLCGMRPEIPADCPDFFAKLIRDCWSREADKRPYPKKICDMLSEFKVRTITGAAWPNKSIAEVVKSVRSSNCSP